jgi:type II secretory ATPase GspE/PulE/Tfp pilus assembly ATPase PilB-like protein
VASLLPLTEAANIKDYINVAYHLKASDLHFIPLENSVNVCTRVNGEFKNLISISKGHYEKLLNAFKFMSGLDVTTTRYSQDANLSVTLDNGITLVLRVCIIPSVQGESLTLRLPVKSSADALQDLGMTLEQDIAMNNLLKRGKGLILITGLTGSGKTTTFYTLLEIAVSAGMKIISMEDPVERFLSGGIVQVQVGGKGGVSYSDIISSSLRSDPDIIAVGEVRDSETAKAVMNATFSSRLVIATMHARDLSHALKRLLHFGISENDAESALACLTHQRLVTFGANENVFRTALFATALGQFSYDDRNLRELSSLTYEAMSFKLFQTLHEGCSVVKIDGDMEGIITGHTRATSENC